MAKKQNQVEHTLVDFDEGSVAVMVRRRPNIML